MQSPESHEPNIRFLRSLAYPLLPHRGDVFSHLNAIAMQTIDPESLHPGGLDLPEPVILHSPLRRVAEAIAAPYDGRRLPLHELREVAFSLEQLCTPTEWFRGRSVIIRQRFKQAFIADTLRAPRAELEREIRSVLKSLTGVASAAVVTHSFRLSLFEGYVESEGRLFQEPERIHEWIHDERERYNWGTGFNVSSSRLEPFA